MRLPLVSTARRIRVQALDRREAAQEARGVLPSPVAEQAELTWALRHSDLFSALPAEQIHTLVAASHRRMLEAGAESVLDDDRALVFVVETGGVKLVTLTMEGQRMVEAVIDPGGFFGQLSTGDGSEQHMVESMERTQLLVVRTEALTALMRDQPDFALSVVQNLDQQRRRLSRRIASLMFKSVEVRVVETVIEMCHHYSDRCTHGMAVDVRLNHRDLAGLVGASRESVSRILSRLQKRAYLRREGRVLCIPSIGRLERLARSYGSDAVG